MKTREKKELQDKSVAQLREMAIALSKELTTAKLDHIRGKLKNSSSLTNTRKSIAQVLSVLREKEITHGKNA